MATGRNILATTVPVIGIVLGATLAGIWFDLSWARPFIWLAGRVA
jgi:hypothetical protein